CGYHAFIPLLREPPAAGFPTSSPFDGGRLRWGCRKEGVRHTPLHMIAAEFSLRYSILLASYVGNTMHDSGATEKLTCRPTSGARVGCERARSAISPQRMTTSAALPRNVTRSTAPVAVLLPFGPERELSTKSTFSGRKNNDAFI